MSDTDQTILRATAGAGLNAGAMLRAAREQAGVHIASLAVALKVPVARLEALEAERFDLLPDPPFVRALAGSICRALKVDPVPILALLPQNALSRLPSRQSKPDVGTFRTSSASTAGLASIGGGLRHPVVWAVVALLLGAAGLMLVPSDRLGEWVHRLRGTAGETVMGSSSTNDLPVPAVAPMGPESTRANAVAVVDPLQSPAAVSAQPSTAGAPAEVVSAAALPASSAASAPGTLAAAAGDASEGLIVFTSSNPSWVRVTNGRGSTVFEKIVKPGEPQVANAAVPLTVVVGNAGATTVRVRGQAFDLVGITRNNVARFEVK